MNKAILPSIIILVGLAAGTAAGYFLRPADQGGDHEGDSHAVVSDHSAAHADAGYGKTDEAHEYLKLANQFVVPVVAGGRVQSLVVLTISLELSEGSNDIVFAREPKLRDELLQLFFDHANSGGFSGSFTDASSLAVLRHNLLTVAQNVLGDIVTDVLITDIMRQDS